MIFLFLGSPLCADENPTDSSAISDGNQNNQHCIDDYYKSSLLLLKSSIAQLKDIYSELYSKRSSPDVDTVSKDKYNELEAKVIFGFVPFYFIYFLHFM